MASRLPATVEKESAVGFKTDPDVWAGLLLLLGGPISKALTAFEHLEFLVSVKEGGFKMLFDLWNDVGWWIAIFAGGAWLLNRYSKRDLPHQKGPSWGFVIVTALMAAVFGSIITVQSSGTVPAVLSGPRLMIVANAQGVSASNCGGQVDGNRLMPFKKDFKAALVCSASDPKVDPLSDTRIAVSNLFEIIPGFFTIVAQKSPNGTFDVVTGNEIPMQFFIVLVPRETPWSKLTSLSDILALGGKIIDPRFYR